MMRMMGLMKSVGNRIDELMERASVELVAMRYGSCEALSLEAMGLAREAGDFERIARIALPLQEARRQRRQIAEDAGTFVITGRRLEAGAILDEHPVGCLLLTDPPYSQGDADALRKAAIERGCMVEVLCLNSVELTASFCAAMERAGDAAVARAWAGRGGAERVDALLAELDRIGDHEIAHQRLAEAARDATRG